MRDILDLINEMSEEEGSVELHDEFDIELSEDVVIESGVIDINEDGILIEGDDFSLQLLAEHGLILEETDWSKYDEPTVSRIAKGKTKPVDRTDYNVPPAMRDKMQGKPGFEKRKEKLKQMGAMEEGLSGAHDYDSALKNLKSFVDYAKANPDENYASDPASKMQTNLALDAVQKLSQEFSKAKKSDYAEIMRDLHGEISGWKSERVAPMSNLIKGVLGTLTFPKEMKEGSADEPVHPDQDSDDKRFDDLDEAKYQGREVPLGKPMKGDVKKSKVYVKKPDGKVVKVNFGDKKMRIKKSNPKRRKSFRARHNCKNPGPRWKARYWSCRAW